MAEVIPPGSFDRTCRRAFWGTDRYVALFPIKFHVTALLYPAFRIITPVPY